MGWSSLRDETELAALGWFYVMWNRFNWLFARERLPTPGLEILYRGTDVSNDTLSCFVVFYVSSDALPDCYALNDTLLCFVDRKPAADVWIFHGGDSGVWRRQGWKYNRSNSETEQIHQRCVLPVLHFWPLGYSVPSRTTYREDMQKWCLATFEWCAARKMGF